MYSTSLGLKHIPRNDLCNFASVKFTPPEAIITLNHSPTTNATLFDPYNPKNQPHAYVCVNNSDGLSIES